MRNDVTSSHRMIGRPDPALILLGLALYLTSAFLRSSVYYLRLFSLLYFLLYGLVSGLALWLVITTVLQLNSKFICQ